MHLGNTSELFYTLFLVDNFSVQTVEDKWGGGNGAVPPPETLPPPEEVLPPPEEPEGGAKH